MHKCNPLAHNGIECEVYAYTCGVCVCVARAGYRTGRVCEYALPACGRCSLLLASCLLLPPAARLCVCVAACIWHRPPPTPLVCGRSLVGCLGTLAPPPYPRGYRPGGYA